MKYKYGSIEVLKIHEDDFVVNRRKIEDDGNDVEEFKVFQCEGAGVKSSSESFHMINDNAHDVLKSHDDDGKKNFDVNEIKQDSQVLSIELSACKEGGLFFAFKSED